MGNKANRGLQRRSSSFQKTLAESSKGKMSQLPPFRVDQLIRLRQLFSQLDTKSASSIQVDKLDDILLLKESPFYPRIKQLIQQQVSKMKTPRLKFQVFAEFLSIFHIATDTQQKFKYLFKLYDWDKDYKLSASDVSKTLELIVNRPDSSENIYSEEDLEALSEEFVEAYGEGGYVRIEAFRKAVNEDQMRFLMTVFF